LERRLAAILAADVVGYTALMGKDEAGTLERLKSLRRELVQPKIAERGGRIVKLMGDGLLAEFPSVVEAVRCAVDIQRDMAVREPDISDEKRIWLRMGINLGDIIVEGNDIYGDGVNVAARLETLADPGGICVSGTVFDHVKSKVGVNFADLGDQQVKNIDQPVQVYRIVLEMEADASEAAGTFAGKADAPELPDKPSIAVLPFSNMSGDPEQEYFSDGITEDIITELSRFRSLFVIARNSSFAFKDQAVDLANVAKRLGVEYILEGSVRKAGNRVRITAQLIEAATHSHLWAERYDRQLEEIFSLQDDITERVVWALVGHLEQTEAGKAKRRGSAHPTAYDLRLRAEEILTRYTRDDTAEAILLLERAVAMTPEYGRALSSLASAYQLNYWWTGNLDWIRRSERTASAALKSSDPEEFTQGTMAYCAAILGEFSRAERLMERALAINPHNRHTIFYQLSIQNMRGNTDAALEASERLRRLDPINPTYIDEEEGYAFYLAGRYEESIAAFERSMPNQFHEAHACLAAAYGQVGDRRSARQAWEQCVTLRPGYTLKSFAAEAIYEKPDDLEHWVNGLGKAGLED
jgi:adenylate cyclase